MLKAIKNNSGLVIFLVVLAIACGIAYHIYSRCVYRVISLNVLDFRVADIDPINLIQNIFDKAGKEIVINTDNPLKVDFIVKDAVESAALMQILIENGFKPKMSCLPKSKLDVLKKV
jgi:hypothetical protein